MKALRIFVPGSASREDLLAIRADLALALLDTYATDPGTGSPAYEAAVLGVQMASPDVLYGETEEFCVLLEGAES